MPRALRRSLKDELGWLGQVLGDARHRCPAQHLAKQRKQTPSSHCAASAGPAGGAHLLKAALDSPRYLQLLAALDGFVLTTNDNTGDKPVGRRGRRVLRKAIRRMMKDGRRAMADPTPERLHTLRISAKRTRYLLEFLKEITGRPGQRLTRTLVALQDTLGMQHDAVVAVSTSGEVMRQLASSGPRSSLAGLRAFAAAQERDAGKYRRRAQALWQKGIARPRVEKDIEAVLDQLGKSAHNDA
jgi:hypothetical protein